ncbi:unnamed protein product [Heterobilharzia americana]|nr:unnamed protein product [Heterobilharzia americana]
MDPVHQTSSFEYYSRNIRSFVVILCLNNFIIDTVLFPLSATAHVFPEYRLIICYFLKVWSINAILFVVFPLFLHSVESIRIIDVRNKHCSLNASVIVKSSTVTNWYMVKCLQSLCSTVSFSQLLISLVFLRKVHSLIMCTRSLIKSSLTKIVITENIGNLTNSSFITLTESDNSSITSALHPSSVLKYTRAIWTIRLYGISVLVIGLILTSQNLVLNFDLKVDLSMFSVGGSLILIKTLSDPILLVYGFRSLRITFCKICYQFSQCYYIES